MISKTGMRATVSGAALVCALAAGSAAWAEQAAQAPGDTTASGQTPPPKKKAASPEQAKSAAVSELVVTGTNIKGVEPIAPVQTVTREDIDRSGFADIGDVMRSLPEDFAGGQNPGTIAAASGGFNDQNITNGSSVNLLGLGSGATLTLLNGHRMPSDGFYDSPDISVIPLGAIQRVEMMTGGSSAIYGSDAVAGVVNFVLRKDYNGLETSAYYGGATEGGDETQIYSLLGGLAMDRWHVLVNAEYEHVDPITASERSFTANAYGPQSLIDAQTSRTVLVSGGVDINDKTTFSVDGLYSYRESGGTTGATGSYKENTELESPNYNVTATLDFKLTRDWDLTLVGTHAASSTVERYQEYFGSTLYAGDEAYSNNFTSIEINATGVLLKLPTGDLRMAAGGGYRGEGFVNDFPGEPAYDLYVTRGSRRVAYAYGEAFLPLVPASSDRRGLEELEFSVAGRFEHYNDFGDTANPKVGLRYVPLDGLSVRATWGTSFKAPSLLQMHQLSEVYAESASFFGYNGDVLEITGGNRNLRPETSKNWTIGADYTAPSLRSLILSVTYFSIDYQNRIVSPLIGINPLTVATNSEYAQFLTINPSPDVVQSTIADAGEFRNYTGSVFNASNVSLIENTAYVNAESQFDTGVNISYRQNFVLGIGDVQTFANGTWSHLTQKISTTAPIQTISGTLFNVPTFRARGGASWSKYGLTAAVILNYTSSETNTEVTPYRPISSLTTVDANLAFKFPDSAGIRHGLAFTLSATNLLDRHPPYASSVDVAYPGLNFDSLNASPIGRFVAFKVTKKW